MKKLFILLSAGAIIVLVVVFSRSPATAGIPHLINYQGMLTELDGTTPVADGTYNLGFKIYGSESGTDSLWWEYHSNVQVTTGLFNVILGSQSVLNLPFDADYWLEIKVGGELMPERLKFTSVGYAYRALVADSAVVAGSGTGGAGGWVDDGTVVRLGTSTDKVGIGTDSPDDKVEVVDGSMNARLGHHYGVSFPLPYDIYSGVRGTYGENVEGFLGRRYWSSLTGNMYYGVYGAATTSGINYGVYGSASGGSTNWAGYFNGDVYANGRVGIGTTSPNDDLHVANHIRVGEDPDYPSVYGELIHDGGGTGFKINAHAGGGGWADLHFQTNATTKMFIESAGKVGIGTTSPSEKLDVEGNIDVSNNKIKSYYGFPKPNYDSGWQGISQGTTITLTHNLGGNVDNYVVDLCFWDEVTGRNISRFGVDHTYFGDYYGANWRSLTSSQITIYRGGQDTSADAVRVRIWVYE